MQAPTISVRWITNRNCDLLCYIGAAATGYLLIYANLRLGISALWLWWFWIVAVDGPHVFATLSRTYLDSEEWRQRPGLLLGSLLWFVVGPIFFTVSLISHSLQPFLLFLTLANLWAYWHVVRQHYGFLVLYQKKNGEPSGKANRIDYWIFYVLMIAPFVSFILRHPQARPFFGLAQYLSQPEKIVLFVIHGTVVAAVVIYSVKELLRLSSGQPLNLPKNLFLLACVPLHLFLFLHPYVSTHIDLRLFAVFVTFYHNIQYHGIVWFYNRNRYGAEQPEPRYGAANLISKNFLIYYSAALVFTLLYRYANWYLVGGIDVAFSVRPETLSSMTAGQILIVGIWWGFAFNHYYLDQKIWRLSKDKRLNQDLGIATAAAIAR